MKKFDRAESPVFLEQNAARWNRQWADLKTQNAGAAFQWYSHAGQPVNQLLMPFLLAQTQEHCSYCDAFPPKKGDKTIDHFLPKSALRHFLKAYEWANLYAACDHCQTSKMEQLSDSLLRPDALEYEFERYFIYQYDSHKIEINPTASDTEQAAALETRRIFDFNHKGQVISRRHSWERWHSKNRHEQLEEIDDFAFRFMFL